MIPKPVERASSFGDRPAEASSMLCVVSVCACTYVYSKRTCMYVTMLHDKRGSVYVCVRARCC